MQQSSLRAAVLKNFDKSLGQFQTKTLDVRVYQKATPEMVYDLLNDAGVMCKHDAKALLTQMSNKPWTIASAAKEDGKAAAPLHITVRVPVNHSPAYHLDCQESPKGLHLSKITPKPI